MRMKEEQIRNVAKIFEAFARAIAKRENIKFSFDSLGYIDIRYNGDLRFNSNITDIQSVTTFRATKLKFREVNKK